MSAFSSLDSASSHLYMLPLSNLSSISNETLSTVLNQDKSNGVSTSVSCIYSCSSDEYRQCRRIRNTAIANQEKENPNSYLRRQDHEYSVSQSTNHPPRLSRFWRTVRSIQLNIRHRRQTGEYEQQINNPEPSNERRTTTTTAHSLHTIGEDENVYHRVHLEIPEPVFNELPTTLPIVPEPVFISLSNNDQDDEQEITSVTGQTLCKLFFHEIFTFTSFFVFISTYCS